MTSPRHLIPWKDCTHGTLYRIDSPYASFGVYRADHESFLVVDQRHERPYLVEEYHVDLGLSLGIIRPLEALGQAPVDPCYDSDASYTALLRFLEAREASSLSPNGQAALAA